MPHESGRKIFIYRINVAEYLIEWKLDGGAEDTETATRGRVGDVLSIVHSSGEGRLHREEGGRTKVVGKQGRESKKRLAIGWTLALPRASNGDVGVGMVGFVASDMGTNGLTATPGGSFFELRRGSEVGLRDGGVGSGGGRLIDRESELHALDSTGFRVLAGLTAALSFNGTLANKISGCIAFKVGSLKLLDAPTERRKGDQGIGRVMRPWD